jgi:threonine dehydrogenase-like Zn-dependent dehydrogenase
VPTALWYDGRHGALLAPAALGDGDLELTALYSGISRGTEGLVWRGRVPPSEHDRMRGPHQEGSFPGPVKYGYAMVATDPSGRPGFVLHPHQDRFRVPTAAFHPLPPHVPPERAVLTPNLETALNAVWDGAVAPGDRIAVVGAGVVGCLIGWLCAGIRGCDVTLVDLLPERAFVADALGTRFARPGEAPRGADVVFHTTATSDGLQTALACAGPEATVVEVSWYGEGATSVALGGAFHSQRLAIRGSQVGRLPSSHVRRWTFARRLQTVLGLLSDDTLDVLIDSESRFEETPATLTDVFEQPTLCHRVRYA